ncbi:hypothetical protein SCLCIDRAFT_136364, partial [Scleroderma citrinum Foug A]
KLAFKVIHSTTSVLPAWDAACAEKGLKPKHIPRDVSTHWNSAFDMLDVAVRYNQVIENIMDKRKLALGKYAIDEHEWELLKQLHKVLKVLEDATLFFSHSTPNLVMVIPAMDYIDESFTKGMLKKRTLDPAIHTAIGLAKKTLNRYYSLTDSSDLYHIAMGKSTGYYSDYHSNLSCSFAPSPQAGVFPSCRINTKMDQHGASNHP